MRIETFTDDGISGEWAGVLDLLDDVAPVSLPDGCGWSIWIDSNNRLIAKRGDDAVILG